MVDLDIQAGRELIEALTEHRFAIDLAFWQQEDESNLWRLVLATPEFDALGPARTYKRVMDVLAGLELPLDLYDTRVISPNDQLAVLVAGMSRLSRSNRGIRVGDSYVGPFHVGGLYIYQPLQATAHP